MNIRILCDQTDCEHNTDGFVKSEQLKADNVTMHDYYCKNPDGVIISKRKGCQSKDKKIK